LNKRTSNIKKPEEAGTYKTNSFFVQKKSLVINTIRTYLEKFAILPNDYDVNGTLLSLKVLDNHSSILHSLMNDDF
jgi:hypothetical protein